MIKGCGWVTKPRLKKYKRGKKKTVLHKTETLTRGSSLILSLHADSGRISSGTGTPTCCF